ncbi:AsnC family transcriptional regulator [Oceanidesulfovibrio indonesiensis]|uniref:AsnC family transcriptional regulator n=1 Tax=Oceanidesulfovibrio indonesiensis TaxID=54767 RepID=A0A7M3MBW5_9BACT|nr:winged helix-turn-helix transcriptional regulator [Oceanidesulfovibrio indonesiensis]TVM15344.1 AsnC family transcriptional regulator [Oceanidesulfovibrio indonesiensis]
MHTQNHSSSWTFLTNHAHVLLCLSRDPSMRMREIALVVGITERAVQRIVSDLCDAGYIRRTREGRRNEYTLNRDATLRHPLERHCSIGEMLNLLEKPLETDA